MIPNAEQAYVLLNRHLRNYPHIIEHSEAVAKKAVHLGHRLVDRNIPVNLNLIKVMALLHDIGYSVSTDSNWHGINGAKLLKRENVSTVINRICEVHVWGGLKKSEAKILGLPQKNYLPRSLEEKIVTYADKLVKGTKQVGLKKRTVIWQKEENLPFINDVINRLKALENEILILLGIRK